MNSKMPLAAVLSAFLLSACAQQVDNKELSVPLNPKGTIVEDLKQSDAAEGNWFTRHPQLNGEEGMSSDLAITMELPKSTTTIVAVIDSGVDYEHEDLKDVMWVNPGESGLDSEGNSKASNGLDDDKNGYIDDIFGWNYIGGADGKNIEKETLEMTREVVRFKKRIAAGDELSEPEQKYFDEVSEAMKKEKDYAESKTAKYAPIGKEIEESKYILVDKLDLTDFSKQTLEAISSSDESVLAAKKHLLETIEKYGDVDRIKRALNYYSDILTYYLNESFDPRSEIVGDKPDDFSDIQYGNNDVKGPDASHGTHVAGIIAASRNNGIGIDGVANNVKIMALRVVPDGDERDKDIALAVKYAADNGARIINMSFGKGFSPNKKEVDEAFLYAAAKGVLILNASGNDNADLDVTISYPSKYLLNSDDPEQNEIPGFINVGASSRIKNLNLPASFSNYGDKSVDLFAPGHRILSAVPGNNYATYSGTSMACPAAAGVAALVMSHFPAANAVQVKAILKETVRKYEGFKVKLPGAEQFDIPVLFSSLSETGGIVDAEAALLLAKQLSSN